jgi:hypothetical protein
MCGSMDGQWGPFLFLSSFLLSFLLSTMNPPTQTATLYPTNLATIGSTVHMPYPIPKDTSLLIGEYQVRGKTSTGDIYEWYSINGYTGVTLTKPTGEIIDWTKKPTLAQVMRYKNVLYCRTYSNGAIEIRTDNGTVRAWSSEADYHVLDLDVARISTHTHGYGHNMYDCYEPWCEQCPGCGGPYDGYDHGGRGCSRTCAYDCDEYGYYKY